MVERRHAQEKQVVVVVVMATEDGQGRGALRPLPLHRSQKGPQYLEGRQKPVGTGIRRSFLG